MIRKLLLPALLTGLLGGCVTGYDYRADGGGYYYGQPSVEYRYHDYYPGYYGYYPYGGYHRHGYPYYYGHYPYYRYGYPYGYPYYYYKPRPRPPVTGTPNPTPPGTRDGSRPPWRDFNNRRRPPTVATPDPVQPTAPRQAEPRRNEGSRMGQAIRRASETRRRDTHDE